MDFTPTFPPPPHPADNNHKSPTAGQLSEGDEESGFHPGAKCVGPSSRRRSRYRHVPHREKPVAVVEKRNARERRRVESVNQAFLRLRRHIPDTNRHKRLSKVKTLRTAIDYIDYLRGLLTTTYTSQYPGVSPQPPHPYSPQEDNSHDACQPEARHILSGMVPYNVQTEDSTALQLTTGLQEWIQQQLQGEVCSPVVGFGHSTLSPHVPRTVSTGEQPPSLVTHLIDSPAASLLSAAQVS